MRVWSLFHYRSYGAFFLQQNRLHNSYGGFTHYRNYRAKRVQIELFFYLFFEYSIEDKKKLAQLVFFYSP